MPKYNLIYNYKQWADMIEALGGMRPPEDCIEGSNIAVTVEIDGVIEINKKEEK